MEMDKKETLRLIFAKLQRYLAVQNLTAIVGAGESNSTNSSNFSASLIDDDFIQKLQDFRRRRDAYVNGTVEIGVHFGRTYVALGAVAVLLNLTILCILISHRRQMLRNVFYMLIFNFAIIDCLKGICLITYAMRMIKSPSSTKAALITSFKFDQYMTLIFRFCNMATILNLLMITLNEFVFIKFPLSYHRLVNKKSALFCILLNWTLCLVFTVGSTFAKGTGDRVFVSANFTSETINSSFHNNTIVRNDIKSDKMEVHYIFAFTLTTFCMICLMVVLICYTIFFRVIREIRTYDTRLYNDANRRMSEMSVCSADTIAAVNSGAVDERKIKRQLLKRYKYVLVIGTVICIYMLYLLTYSTIQIFQYLHLSYEKPFTSDPVEHRKSYVVRWILQILVGLHSVFQPLCYFRMKEFRHFINRAFGFPCTRRSSSSSINNHRDLISSLIETASHLPSMSMTKSSTTNRERWYYRFLRNSNDFSTSSRRNSTFMYYETPSRRISSESYYQVNGVNGCSAVNKNQQQLSKNGTKL